MSNEKLIRMARDWQAIATREAAEFLGTPEGAARLVEAKRYGLLADALAQQPQGSGEPVAVGEAGTMPGTTGFTMACFKADEVPVGTKLYTAQPSAQQATGAADPENDPPACEPSDWSPPAGYDGDGSVAAMARRAAQQATGLLTDERIMEIARQVEREHVDTCDEAETVAFARAVLAAATQAQPEVEALYREVGRKMVEITTTVRDPDEWLCIPELWLQCMQERDEALRKLAAPTTGKREPREQRLAAAMKHLDKEGPLPGMISAFEQRFGQSWTDRDWCNETSVWACAWRAALAAPTTSKREPLTREGCHYLCNAGSVCNKCGHVHGITREQR